MTHDPGDAPVPDPDDRRAPAIAPPDADVRETPTGARPPAEVTASDAGRPDVAESDVGRREVRAADVGRPEVATPGVAASEQTAPGVADPAAAGGGAPTADSPDGYAPGDGPATPRTGRDAQAVEDVLPAGRDASAGWPAPSVLPGAVPGPDPSPTRRPAERRSLPDPYETTRLPVTPTPDPRFADTPPRPAGDPSAAPPNRAAGTRVGAALFFDDRLADGQSTTYLHDADDASERTVVDDAPTEAMAVVDAGGRHRAEPGGDTDADRGTDWRPPRQTSRLTTVLVIALLVAIGFLAGVFVGRSAAPAPSGEQPRPAATSPARPGALH